ncbi:MAG: DUF4386 family protein [Opitutaceae bacterium]|nr:DUF4386 family protein [Opitutaceae bacterium]
MSHRKIVILGGISFIVGALAFVAVFGYLAAKFSYPDILDGAAAEVLPRLREGGAAMRAVWAVYAFLPLLLLPGAVGALHAFPASRPRMTLALVALCVGVLAMCLGLMRWPSIHWALAEGYAQGDASTQAGIAAVFHGLNLYLGNYIGEFLGEAMLAAFFFLAGLSLLAERRFPRWLGWTGTGFSVLFLIGALRNVTDAVQGIASLNNSLLPLWMIVLGVALLRYPDHS